MALSGVFKLAVPDRSGRWHSRPYHQGKGPLAAPEGAAALLVVPIDSLDDFGKPVVGERAHAYGVVAPGRAIALRGARSKSVDGTRRLVFECS